jgi:hypothetical protein
MITLTQYLAAIGIRHKTPVIDPNHKAAGVVAKIVKKSYMPNDNVDMWDCVIDINKVYYEKIQRPLNKKHATNIGDLWEDQYSNHPIISCRNDSPQSQFNGKWTLFVDDGQHTLFAIKHKQRATKILVDGVPVLVTRAYVALNITYAGSCRSYFRRNDHRKKLAPANKFNAGFEAEIEEQQTVIRLARAHNLKNPIDSPGKKGHDLRHLGEYLEILASESKGEAFLDAMFRLQNNCWLTQLHSATFFRAITKVMFDNDLLPYKNAVRDVKGRFEDTVNALRSSTLIPELKKRATEIAARKECCGVYEAEWREAIEERLIKYNVIKVPYSDKDGDHKTNGRKKAA